jgi:hypothetical protein
MSFRTKNLMVTVLPEAQQVPPQVVGGLQTYFCCPNQTQIWTCWQASCPHFSITCPNFSLCQRFISQCLAYSCPYGSIDCPNGTVIDCTPTWIDPLTPIEQTIQFSSPEALGALQQQLARLQEAAQAQMTALQAKQQPQTLEEAEVLEKHLNEALNEVKATKDALRRKSSK